MRTLSGFILLAVATTGLLAQNRSGFVTPRSVTRNIPNVVFPGGTSAMRGVQRTTGNILYPGGGGPQIGVPGIPTTRSTDVQPYGRRRSASFVGYPVYVGGGYDGYYPEQVPVPAPAPEPNVIVVYPQPAAPIIINHYGYGDSQQSIATDRPGTRIFDLPGRQAVVEEPRQEADQFLLAFQDRSIYSAVAYWVDGETLHYITAGNTHNQASVSLVDRDLTARLNKDSGREVKLPALK
jgi:hypothetical protein